MAGEVVLDRAAPAPAVAVERVEEAPPVAVAARGAFAGEVRPRGAVVGEVGEGRAGRAGAGSKTLFWVSPRPGDATTAAHVPFAVGWTTRLFAMSAGRFAMMGEGAIEKGARCEQAADGFA